MAVVTKADRQKFEPWRKSMTHVRMPHKGCFKISFPSTEWREVACTAAPERSYPPRALYTVGSAVDFSAVVAGHIASATGSFDAVNVTSEMDFGTPDIYSLQLNSEFFVSPACAGSANPNVCKGWQQFIYSSNLASAFIEYWLIDYAAPCPAGWTQVAPHCLKTAWPFPFPPSRSRISDSSD
ncbi:MAG TPA: hypothetical protein VGQ46_17720 [Thermoanaerobaculia bacterium]|nr:hypothetical protein [Thermoanaerobaculia bacterium]